MAPAYLPYEKTLPLPSNETLLGDGVMCIKPLYSVSRREKQF